MNRSEIDNLILKYLIWLSLNFKTKHNRPKGYCFPSRGRILFKINKRLKKPICLRTLKYHIKALVDQGYLRRQLRPINSKDGFRGYHSNLYFPTMAAYKRYGYNHKDVKVIVLSPSAKLKALGKGKPLPDKQTVYNFSQSKITRESNASLKVSAFFPNLTRHELYKKINEIKALYSTDDPQLAFDFYIKEHPGVLASALSQRKKAHSK